MRSEHSATDCVPWMLRVFWGHCVYQSSRHCARERGKTSQRNSVLGFLCKGAENRWYHYRTGVPYSKMMIRSPNIRGYMLMLNYQKQGSWSIIIIMSSQIREARLQWQFHIWEYKFNTYFWVVCKDVSV